MFNKIRENSRDRCTVLYAPERAGWGVNGPAMRISRAWLRITDPASRVAVKRCAGIGFAHLSHLSRTSLALLIVVCLLSCNSCWYRYQLLPAGVGGLAKSSITTIHDEHYARPTSFWNCDEECGKLWVFMWLLFLANGKFYWEELYLTVQQWKINIILRAIKKVGRSVLAFVGFFNYSVNIKK